MTRKRSEAEILAEIAVNHRFLSTLRDEADARGDVESLDEIDEAIAALEKVAAAVRRAKGDMNARLADIKDKPH